MPIAARMEADCLELRRNSQVMQRAYAVIVEAAAWEAQAGELTLAIAEELLLRLRALANPSFREISVDESFKEWIESQRPHEANSTIHSYEDARQRITLALGKAKANGALNELPSDDITKAVEKVADKVKAITLTWILKHCAVFLNQLVRVGSPRLGVSRLRTSF